MAGDDSKVSFELDLDAKKFVDSAEEAFGSIKKIAGLSGEVSGLSEKIFSVGETLGAVALVAETFKVALDMTVEGEKVQQVERQFEALSDQVGVSAKDIKEQMIAAAGGMVSTSDALQIANKNIIQMGDSASKLPDIMELARKATTIYGGTVKDTFAEMSQAIANGNERWLKQHGIIINTRDAIDKYAKANGLAANALSETAKHQAVMNAALEASKQRFDGVEGSAGQTTEALQAAKVAWSELVELIDVAVSKTVGPHLARFFNDLKSGLSELRTMMQVNLGDGAEAAAAQVKLLEIQIEKTKQRIDGLKKSSEDKSVFNVFGGNEVAQIHEAQQALAGYEAELTKLKAQQASEAKTEESATGARSENAKKRIAQDLVDHEQRRKNEAAFAAASLALERKQTDEKIKNLNSVEDIEKLINERRLQNAKEHAINLQKIASDTALDEGKKKQLAVMEDRRFELQQQNFARETLKLRKQFNEEYVANSKTAFDGIARAGHQMTMKAKADLADWGKQGIMVSSALADHTVGAFKEIGKAIAAHEDLGKSAAEAMKNAFLGMIGDVAVNYGTMIVMESIFPPNPLGLVAGGALIAFGAALQSMSGSGGSAPAADTSAAGGGGPGATAEIGVSPGGSGAQLEKQQQPQRIVNVNIQGHYLQTQESQRTIMEIMRNETDATGFQYNQIGV